MKLRGNCPAKVDEKGRLKIPAVFLEALKEYGNQFYITSTTGETARIYPMQVWSEIEDKLAKLPTTNSEEKIPDEDELLRPGGGDGWAGKSAAASSAARVGANEGRSGCIWRPQLSRCDEPYARPGSVEKRSVHGRGRQGFG